MKSIVLVLVFLFLLAPSAPTQAQDCSMGLYLNPEGTVDGSYPYEDTFHVYAVIFTENVVNAASFDLEYYGANSFVFLMDTAYGSAGNGLDIHTPGGYNVGLGECAIGFAGAPILVADFTFFKLDDSCLNFWLKPNLENSSEGVLVSDCSGTLSPCDIGAEVNVCAGLPTESTSFGAVKSLYGGE